jgi:hypothetical protein
MTHVAGSASSSHSGAAASEVEYRAGAVLAPSARFPMTRSTVSTVRDVHPKVLVTGIGDPDAPYAVARWGTGMPVVQGTTRPNCTSSP